MDVQIEIATQNNIKKKLKSGTLGPV